MSKRTAITSLVEAAAFETDEQTTSSARYRAGRIKELGGKFTSEHDPVVGLVAAHLALSNHDYVPRGVAEWLANGIALYMGGRRKTLDDALGLSAPGRASPLRRSKEARALRAALGRMYSLQMLGATIPQAAAMVETITPNYTAATLADRYRRSGYTADLRVLQQHIMDIGMPPFDPEPELAAYFGGA